MTSAMRSGAGLARAAVKTAAASWLRREVRAFVRLAVLVTAEPRVVRGGEHGPGTGEQAGRLAEHVVAGRGVHRVPGRPVGYRRVGMPGTGAQRSSRQPFGGEASPEHP
jgi:hypothetical protein